MIDFPSDYFQKFNFSRRQLDAYFDSVKRQLRVAADSGIPEVMFEFSYNALIKLGIYLLAKKGYKVRSVPGHHVKILEKMSEIVGNEDILVIGDRMRQERNFNLYDEGRPISRKEADEFFGFVKGLINLIKK